jgi:hypothetical protein
MYIQNSSKFKVLSPLQRSNGLIRLKPVIAYFAYTWTLCGIMCKKKLIAGVKVTQQMSKAKIILNNQVIHREKLFQIRKREGKLSPELKRALKANS